MTGPAPDPDDAAPVDRRWFEEALRSQGFVVEPPADDPEAHPSVLDTGGSAVDAGIPSADASVERPPMPSALLARIAARGQPWTVPAPEPDTPPQEPIAEPPMEPLTRPDDTQGDVTAVVAAPSQERPAPWASAVVAPVAPWAAPSDGPQVVEPEPEPQPEPERVAEPEPEPVEAVSTAFVPLDEPVPAPLADEVMAASVPSGVPDPAAPEEVTHDAEPAVAPVAVLESPYTPAAGTAAAVSAAPRPAAVTAGPEASEGELWALVGASEPTAAQASGSEAARVILTILTAFVILVIAVGALVLASQIA